jgi:PqqD family protein of HPr-rel-A system
MRWQAVPAADLSWAAYDDNFVLFHRPSGQTHFINAVTAVLLCDVLSEPRSARAAAQALVEAQHATDDPDYEPHVLGLILRLEELGLVRRIAA